MKEATGVAARAIRRAEAERLGAGLNLWRPRLLALAGGVVLMTHAEVARTEAAGLAAALRGH